MTKNTIQRGSEEYLKLLAYVVNQTDGTPLDYTTVERATGVRMDRKGGRDKLRRAIKRSRKEYEMLRGIGPRLAAPDSCIGILSFRLQLIDNRVKDAERSQTIVQQTFLKDLPQEEQKTILGIGALFGSIRLFVDRNRQIYAAPQRLQLTGEAKPIVPE